MWITFIPARRQETSVFISRGHIPWYFVIQNKIVLLSSSSLFFYLRLFPSIIQQLQRHIIKFNMALWNDSACATNATNCNLMTTPRKILGCIILEQMYVDSLCHQKSIFTKFLGKPSRAKTTTKKDKKKLTLLVKWSSRSSSSMNMHILLPRRPMLCSIKALGLANLRSGHLQLPVRWHKQKKYRQTVTSLHVKTQGLNDQETAA